MAEPLFAPKIWGFSVWRPVSSILAFVLSVCFHAMRHLLVICLNPHSGVIVLHGYSLFAFGSAYAIGCTYHIAQSIPLSVRLWGLDSRCDCFNYAQSYLEYQGSLQCSNLRGLKGYLKLWCFSEFLDRYQIHCSCINEMWPI